MQSSVSHDGKVRQVDGGDDGEVHNGMNALNANESCSPETADVANVT